MKTKRKKTLGNFGVYMDILKGVTPYKSFLVEVNDEYYFVRDIKIDATKGVILTINEEPFNFEEEAE